MAQYIYKNTHFVSDYGETNCGAISLLWILSPIDITLYFNGLGIFDYISQACWSKSMCGHRTVDVLWCTASMNYWTDNMNTAITNKQRREISHLEYVFISRQVVEIAC